MGINNVCWFVVNKNVAEKIWGKEDEDLDKLSFEVQKTGGDDSKRWIVGISAGDSSAKGQISCKTGEKTWTVGEEWGIEKWDESYKQFTAIFWKPEHGRNIPVIKNKPLASGGFKVSGNTSPENILFCFGGKSWKTRWDQKWDNINVNSQAKKSKSGIECGNPKTDKEHITEADGKKFNEST